MALVLGLGNPGERYARTRHNAGWQVLDELRRRWGATPGAGTGRYREWQAEHRGRQVALVEPLTFMNLSGEALAEWRERNPGPAALLVVVDDVYLPVGTVRLRPRGSSGGHRGLDSIEQALGTQEYERLRVGVGAVAAAELREHVLEEPGADEAAALMDTIRVAADAVECWLDEGMLAAMNRFNRRADKEAEQP